MADDLIYLASPYTDPDPAIERVRFQMACKCAANLMRAGAFIFSPIAHTHPIKEYGLPGHWDYWEKFDRIFLEVCSELWILTIPGWRQSRGVSYETVIVRKMGKLVCFVNIDGQLIEEPKED